jgi:hypothetical protein
LHGFETELHPLALLTQRIAFIKRGYDGHGTTGRG